MRQALTPLGVAAFLVPLLAVLAPKGEAVVLLACGLWQVLQLAGRRDWPRPSPWLAVPAALLVAWAAAAMAWAPAEAAPPGKVAMLAAVFVAGFAFVHAAARLAPAERARVGTALVAGWSAGFLLLAAEVAPGGPALKLYYAMQGDPAAWAAAIYNRRIAYLLLLAPAVAAVLLHRRGPAAAALPLAAAALLTVAGAMESALVGVAAGAAAGLAAAAAPRAAGRAVAVLAVVAVAAMPFLPFGPLAPERLGEQAGRVAYSAEHRLHIWRFAAERIAERPLAGWGAAATRHVPGGSAELPGGGTYISLHTHNGTLQVWLELGAVGAGLLAALAAALALAAAATPSRGDAVLALAGFAAAGTVFNLSFGIWQEDWLAMLALTAALLAATRRPAGRRD